MWKYVLRKMIRQKGATSFVIMIFLSFFVSSISPYLNGQFVDLLVYNVDIASVISFSVFIAGIGIIGSILSYFANILTTKILSKTTFSLLFEQVELLEQTDLYIAEKFNAAYITQRVFQDTSTVVIFVISNFLSIFLNALLIVGIVACFLLISPFLTLFIVLLLVPYIVLFIFLKKPLYTSSKQKKEADAHIFSVVGAQISQIFHIQLDARFNQSQDELYKSFYEYFPHVIRASKFSYLFSSTDSIIQVIFQSTMFIFAGIQIIRGSMTIGDFIMINSYFSLLLKSVKYYTAIYKQYQDALASFNRVNEIKSYPKLESGKKRKESLNAIEVHGLTFDICEATPPITLFQNLSYRFEAGKTYAIIGANGSGKSTLLKILTGLYRNNNSVLYDTDLPIDLDMTRLRLDYFSVVPQNLYIPGEKVHSYIAKALQIPYISVYKLLQQSQYLISFATAILDMIDKDCTSLSGGELRKLHLWIAINKSADVLILDEPTTGLDAESQQELAKYVQLNEQNKMIIIMTHDSQLISVVQHVLSIDKGDLNNEYSNNKL